MQPYSFHLILPCSTVEAKRPAAPCCSQRRHRLQLGNEEERSEVLLDFLGFLSFFLVS